MIPKKIKTKIKIENQKRIYENRRGMGLGIWVVIYQDGRQGEIAITTNETFHSKSSSSKSPNWRINKSENILEEKQNPNIEDGGKKLTREMGILSTASL